MVDHAARPPLPERHVEGVEHHLHVQGGRHRPADDPAAERIEHNRQIEEAAPRWNIRDIGHPQPIGLIRGEIAVDEIGRLARPIPHGRDGALATAHADQTSVQHQPSNTFATDTNAGFRKINLETRCSIGAFRRGVRRADFRGQRGVHQGTRRGRPLHPRVIAASVTGRQLSIPLLRYPIAGHLLLYGVGARPPPDGIR